jgi:hypothetical protein
MNGVPASRPAGLGTQGRLLQQSALEAHDCPAATQLAPVQRGTPMMSVRHVSIVSQLPAQQSQEALQDIVASLQTSPFGLHPIGLRQTPSGPPERAHAPAAAPQQSESLLQTSPTTWQPLAGWQTRTPVGPYGAQSRLQHEPPQTEAPASVTTPPHTVPSTIEQLADVVGGAAQVP